jgi:hypothetical protein
MITLCSVLLNTIQSYKDILIESILQKTKLISEVIFANNSIKVGYYKEWIERNIIFKEYGSQEDLPAKDCGNQHAFGLHYAIDRTTKEYIYLCDPDIFFYTAAEEFFFDVMKKHNLQAVGASHHSAAQLAGTFFPWHGNIIMKKSDLPDKDFLKDNLLVKGKYLMAGTGSDQAEVFPNPSGNFDTASALWLWAKNKDWKWLSFQTLDSHTYTTQYFRGNVKIYDKFKKQNLFYHAVSGAISKEAWEPFRDTYMELKNDNTLHSSNTTT